MFREIRYRTLDGEKLAGILSIPKNPHGFVLMMHGITESKDEYLGFYSKMAKSLHDNGVASLRFDFRGHGESTGSSLDISVIGDVLDIKASIAQVRKYWKRPISLVATSFGAGPTLIVASEQPQDFRNLLLIAPVIDYDRTFLKPETAWARASFNPRAFKSLQKTGYLVLDDSFRLSARLIEEFKVIKPYLFLREIRIPTLIVHGDKDSMVPYDVSFEWAKSNKLIRFVTLKNADHGYPDYRDEEGNGPRSMANLQKIISELIRLAK
ncbi:MAG: alpha/beta fold hydrolase [Candidatus Bathyarchaeia archaeon]